MTYIEFFDIESIVNICSAIANPPDRIVIVNGDRKPVERRIPHYKRVLADRGYNVDITCETVNKNNLQAIIKKLTDIVETDTEIHVDLTGGEDLLLVAVGIVCERFPEKKIQLHRFNVSNNTFYDCDGDKDCAIKKCPTLSVEENIRIHGGDVVFEDRRAGTTPIWDMNAEFEADIEKMWNICRKDAKAWNTQLGVFAFAELLKTDSEDSLTTTASVERLVERLTSVKAKYVALKKTIGELEGAGLIQYTNDGTTLSVTYKNEQIKKCLTKAGCALEMKIYKTVRGLCENGTPMYNALNGVFIDWDGEDDEENIETENEVDILAMKGLVPVFISCKNGKVDVEELYKLKSVSDRFGGAYARRILFTSTLNIESDYGKSFIARGKAMGIEIIHSVPDISDEDLESKLKNIWRK